jgi:hypothetical protein
MVDDRHIIPVYAARDADGVLYIASRSMAAPISTPSAVPRSCC